MDLIPSDPQDPLLEPVEQEFHSSFHGEPSSRRDQSYSQINPETGTDTLVHARAVSPARTAARDAADITDLPYDQRLGDWLASRGKKKLTPF